MRSHTSIPWSPFRLVATLALLAAGVAAQPVHATAFFFSNGNPDGRLASASRPASAGKVETETADDFVLAQATRITSLTFTGLVPTGFSVNRVLVELYRVFPNDSDPVRAITVPTRANSPSDVAFDRRSGAQLNFSTSILATQFTASNSVINGINKAPNQFTGGEGAVTGQEVEFTVDLTVPFDLPADHYFLVPQVQLNAGEFLWLSAPKPTVTFAGDLQSWIRNDSLDPDWLRIGTDITRQNPYNAAFTLSGTIQGPAVIPEPADAALLAIGLAGVLMVRRRR